MIIRAWLAWLAASIVVGYGVAVSLAVAYPGRVPEAALAGFCWGVSVTPAVLRTLGRRLRG